MFTGVGIRVAVTQQFSHYTWGTVRGTEVGIAGFFMLALGFWMFIGYYRQCAMLRKQQKYAFLMLVAFASLGPLFLMAFACPVPVRAVIVLGPFLAAHLLHRSILAHPQTRSDGES